MTLEIRTPSVLNSMTKDRLKYYLRGYNLPDDENKIELRRQLITFIGISETTVQFLYNAEPRRENISRQNELRRRNLKRHNRANAHFDYYSLMLVDFLCNFVFNP